MNVCAAVDACTLGLGNSMKERFAYSFKSKVLEKTVMHMLYILYWTKVKETARKILF